MIKKTLFIEKVFFNERIALLLLAENSQMKGLMNLLYKLLGVLLAFVTIISCSSDYIFEDDNAGHTALDPIEEGQAELRLGVPVTRATVDNSLDLRWQRGDRITVMAYDGSTQLFQREASFWANLTNNSSVGSQAYFKVKFDANAEADLLAQVEGMSDGRCYAVSPVKGVAINGTTATMTIPSVQSGEYSDAPDFMTARSNSISELKVCTGQSSGAGYNPNDSKYINDINLTFTHHTHAFRVTIPDNYLGKYVTKAFLKFPFAVAGDVTVDYTTGAITAVNNTSDLIVVEFKEPKSAGDEFWVFINGVENKGKIDIRFQATDGTYTERRIASFTQKNWSAGVVSKINVSVPVATTITKIACQTPYSQLGEPVTDLHFTLASGYYFTNFASTSSVAIDANKDYTTAHDFEIFSDLIDNSFRTANHSLVFESVNAIVPMRDPIVFNSNLVVGEQNFYQVPAPYLFFEDFSSVSNFSSNDAYSGGVIAGDKSAHSFLDGWTGGRIGASAGLSIRLACRRETATTRATARVDSAPILSLKSGSSVKVKVVYDYGMDQEYGGFIGTKAIGQTCYEGRTTDASALSSGNETGTFESEFNINEDNNGSWNNLPHKNRSYSFSGCTSVTRLSWRTRPDYYAGASNNTCWLYIDNVRVSIVQ